MKLAFAAIILIAASLGVSAKPNAHHNEQPAVAAATAPVPAPKEHAEHAVAPTVPVVPVVAAPAVASVAAEPSVIVHHSPLVPVVSQYSPAAVVPVVPEPAAPAGVAQQVKPVVAAHSGEQYGQPESAAIPANYKPFGSWGLYIGGNPADGYYTNYYKSLSSSVEKQAGLPISSLSSSSAVIDKPHIRAGLNPLLRQASVSSSPYQGADYYPFSYSALDFAANPAFAAPHALSYSSIDSPLVVPSQYIPEPYSTKRAGQQSQAPVKGQQQQQQVAEQQQQQQQVKSQVKGQQQLPHFYAAPISGAAVVAQQPQQQQPQVVAYPVPVGSQIVGSQVGVDGAFFPYGVHAFTKYAIKPVVEAQAVSAQQASAAAFPSIYHSGAYSPAHFAVTQPGYKFAPVSTGSSIHHQPSFYASGASNLASGLSGYYAYPAVHDSFERK